MRRISLSRRIATLTFVGWESWRRFQATGLLQSLTDSALRRRSRLPSGVNRRPSGPRYTRLQCPEPRVKAALLSSDVCQMNIVITHDLRIGVINAQDKRVRPSPVQHVLLQQLLLLLLLLLLLCCYRYCSARLG